MDEARRKLTEDAENEITRFCGGDTQYQIWLRDSANPFAQRLVPFRQLMDLALGQKLPVSEELESQFKRLQLSVDFMTLASYAIEQLGEMMRIDSRLGQALPLPMFEVLCARYVSAHRVAYTLWLHRDDDLPLPLTGDPNVN